MLTSSLDLFPINQTRNIAHTCWHFPKNPTVYPGQRLELYCSSNNFTMKKSTFLRVCVILSQMSQVLPSLSGQSSLHPIPYLNKNQMFALGFPCFKCAVYFNCPGMSLDNASKLFSVGERGIFVLPSVDYWSHLWVIYMSDCREKGCGKFGKSHFSE